MKGLRYGDKHLKGVAVLVGAAADDAAVLEQVADDGGAVGGYLGGRLPPSRCLRRALRLRCGQRQAKDLPVCRCHAAVKDEPAIASPT